jgi:hypothetical protein
MRAPVRRSPGQPTRVGIVMDVAEMGAVNTNRTPQTALQGDPKLLAEFGRGDGDRQMSRPSEMTLACATLQGNRIGSAAALAGPQA